MKIASQNRRTRETRQRDAERRERALLFLTEEETNEALRKSRTTALSLVNSLSNALTLSVQQKRNSFIRGVLFIIIRTRESLRSVPLSSVCGKEKTRETTKNAKGSALCNKSQSCPPLWCVHRVLLHRIRFLFCCVCVRGRRRRRSFERTKEALSRSIIIFFDDRFITDDDTFRFRRVLCSTLSCFGDDDASATD